MNNVVSPRNKNRQNNTEYVKAAVLQPKGNCSERPQGRGRRVPRSPSRPPSYL